MKPIAPMRRIDHLENLRVRIANRIGRPAVLKINVASAVEIPDEITFNVINNDLVCRPKTAAAGFLEFFVESKAITKQRDAPFESLACFWSWELICHSSSSSAQIWRTQSRICNDSCHRSDNSSWFASVIA
jgi:hypothetical protein